MKRWGWPVGGGAVVGAVLALVLLAPAGLSSAGALTRPGAAAMGSAAGGGVRVPRLVWRACGGGLQCSRAVVPLDYSRPRGATITLSLIRLPATDRRRRIGSLFVNPGGPGGSAESEVRVAKLLFSPAVRARFDIVGLDPRGTGGSAPVRCFESQSDAESVFKQATSVPSTLAQYAAAVAAARSYAARCVARKGELLDHLSTANDARDLDLIRQAVGDRGLTYDGISYGTVLGATYAAMFPRHVRALVLDGNLDPRQYTSGSGSVFLREHGNEGAFSTLQQFFRLCTAAASRCAFATGGDPAAKFAALAKRLRATPIVLPGGQRVTYGDLLELTFDTTLYSASKWRAGAQALQDLYTATHLNQIGQQLDAVAPIGASPAAAGYDNTNDAQIAILCGESPNPRRPDAYIRIGEHADLATPYAGSWVTWLGFGCTFWKAWDASRYTGSYRSTPAYPALILNNRYDPITPLRNAVTMSRLLRGSRLVTVNGWGHTTLTNPGRCVAHYQDQYLINRRLPPWGATCAPDYANPFLAPDPASR